MKFYDLANMHLEIKVRIIDPLTKKPPLKDAKVAPVQKMNIGLINFEK